MVGDERELLRVEEAAAILAVSRTRAYALVQAGMIPSVRLGSSLRIPVRQLREGLPASRRHSMPGMARARGADRGPRWAGGETA